MGIGYFGRNKIARKLIVVLIVTAKLCDYTINHRIVCLKKQCFLAL